MVIKAEKDRMRQFLTDRLEDAETYNILESDLSHLLVTQKPGIVESPARIHILLQNSPLTEKAYRDIVNSNVRKNIYTATVHFKDGKLSFIPAASDGHFKRHGKSLKHYSPEQVNSMLKVRTPEKMTLAYEKPSSIVVYYQPESSNLEEAIRGFSMTPVTFDYDHLSAGDERTPADHGYGFAKTGTVSKDFKIAEEEFKITEGGIHLYGTRPGVLIATVRPEEKSWGEQIKDFLRE